MPKRLTEGVTIFGAMFLFSGIDSSIWCGVLGLALLMVFCLELYIWEGGLNWERTKR